MEGGTVILIFYEATVACSVSRAGLLSHAKPIQARLSGDSAQMPTEKARKHNMIKTPALIVSTAVCLDPVRRLEDADDGSNEEGRDGEDGSTVSIVT